MVFLTTELEGLLTVMSSCHGYICVCVHIFYAYIHVYMHTYVKYVYNLHVIYIPVNTHRFSKKQTHMGAFRVRVISNQ